MLRPDGPQSASVSPTKVISRRNVIVRNRSRDTVWFAMLAEELSALKPAYEKWLAPDNFDEQGRQKTRLSELTSAALSMYRGKPKGTGADMRGAH